MLCDSLRGCVDLLGVEGGDRVDVDGGVRRKRRWRVHFSQVGCLWGMGMGMSMSVKHDQGEVGGSCTVPTSIEKYVAL